MGEKKIEFQINGFYRLEENGVPAANQTCKHLLALAQPQLTELLGTSLSYGVEEVVPNEWTDREKAITSYDVHFVIKGSMSVRSDKTQAEVTDTISAQLRIDLPKIETILATGVGIAVEGEEV